MAATIELFKFDLYHGAEIHVRILGSVNPTNLIVSTTKETLRETDLHGDGVYVFDFPHPKSGARYTAGTYTVTAILTDGGTDYTETTSFTVPEEIETESKPYRFKDFWIAIGQPGAYTNATTYENGLGEIKPYYERVIGAFNDFKIRIKHIPYSLMAKAKNVTVQTWKDEDGDDMWLPRITGNVPGEYLPQLTHEVVGLEPTFVVYLPDNNVNKANELITSFIKAIEGRWLRVWDEYTQVGYTGVMLADVDDDPKFKRRNYDCVVFKLTFRVNGPNVYEPFEDIRLAIEQSQE